MKKIILMIVLCCISSAAYAQKDTNNAQKPISDWQFEVSPYLWIAGSSGTISFLDQSANVDAKFKDILSNLEFGFFMHLEAKKGKWVFFGDISYISVEKSGTIEMANTNANIELKQTLAEIGSGYNLITTLDNWLIIDALAGLRYFEIDNLINVEQQQTLEKAINVTDPFVGLRFRTVSDNWINGARLDIGGFGIGSKISWRANLLVGYQFSEVVSATLGYQVYSIDYEKDNFGLNLISSGFATGINFRF
jgi:hypothetical protein